MALPSTFVMQDFYIYKVYPGFSESEKQINAVTGAYFKVLPIKT